MPALKVEIDHLPGKWAGALDMMFKRAKEGKSSLPAIRFTWLGEPYDPAVLMANLHLLTRNPDFELTHELSALARVPRDWVVTSVLRLDGDRFRVNQRLADMPLVGRVQTIELRKADGSGVRQVRAMSMATVILFESADDHIYVKLKYC